MVLSNIQLNYKNYNIISFTLFRSYNTKFLYKDRSAIDILVLMKNDDFNLEFQIEDNCREKFTEYFENDNIHFTFITLRSLISSDTVLSDNR